MGRTRAAREEAAGVTLLELILVMFLLATVLGLGLGMFATLDLGRQQAAGAVKNVLRSAINTAIASRAPARVRIDSTSGELTPEVLEVVGTWHFENRRLQGGNDLLGKADPELFVPDGYIGDAISFTDRIGVEATIPVDLDPAFDFRDGFAIECVVRHEGVGGGRLLSISDHVRIELGQGGVVRASFLAEGMKGGRVQQGGTVIVQSRPGVIWPERWTRLRVFYDRREFVIEIDGVVVASVDETAHVWEIDSGLVLSDERHPFPGSVDNLVISAMVSAASTVLSETVTIASAPEVIQFVAGGGLDRRVHREPAIIVLEFDDGSREELGVGFYGTVE